MAGLLQGEEDAKRIRDRIDIEDVCRRLAESAETIRKRRAALPFEIQVRLAKRDKRRMEQLLAASAAGDSDLANQLMREQSLGLDEDGELDRPWDEEAERAHKRLMAKRRAEEQE